MSYTAKVVYGDDSSVLFVYRLRQIADHFLKLKEENSAITFIKSMPVTPWLIAMAFDDAIAYKSDNPIKCIEIQERVNA